VKIAVLSDIHDHIWNLAKALELVNKEKCEAIIFCGDFCAPFVAPYLTQTGLPVYTIFGNNDEDQWAIVQRAGVDKIHAFSLGSEYGEVELSGKKIAFIHYPKLAQALATSGNYDAVFFGHNHESSQEVVGKTLLANPGAVCGIQKGKSGIASFGTYNTVSNTFSLMEIK
jgi:hypothetical protein